MADFTALKTAIQNAIKQNGNEEITGNLLQEVLLAIVTTIGDGSINDLVTALGSEATTRQQADGTLQQNIDAEAQARQQAVSAEAQARQLADSTLQEGINTAMQAINAINNAITNGCVYAGIATPSSTPASGKVFYLALTAGTYTNYGGLEVPQGINILKNNGSTWLLDSFLGIDDAPTPSSNNLIKSGGAFDFVMKNGSAFDLSAYNNGTTYADLNAALTALNALPAAYKKGGMSVKYVQTYDNKYIQARLMANAFTTDITKWQVVDDEPTAGSNNLVKSGGVIKANSALKSIFPLLIKGEKCLMSGFINSSNNFVYDTNRYGLSIPVNEGDSIEIKGNSTNTGYIAFLQENPYQTGNVIYSSATGYNSRKTINATSTYSFTIPADCKYLYVAYHSDAPNFPQVLNINGFSVLEDLRSIIKQEFEYLEHVSSYDSYINGVKSSECRGIISSTNKYDNSIDRGGVCIPVVAGDSIRIKAKNVTTNYAVLKENLYTQKNAIFSEASGFTSRLTLSSNASTAFNIPSDGKFLYIATLLANGDATPAELVINDVDITKIVNTHISLIYNSLKELTYDGIEIFGIEKYVKQGFIGSNNAFSSSSGSGICIPVKAGDQLVIGASSEFNALYALLKDDCYVTGIASFSSDYPAREYISKGTISNVITIPNDCKYLHVVFTTSSNTPKPQFVKINGMDILVNNNRRIEEKEITKSVSDGNLLKKETNYLWIKPYLDGLYSSSEATAYNALVSKVQERKTAGCLCIALGTDSHHGGAYATRYPETNRLSAERSIAVFNNLVEECDAAIHGGDISCDYGTSVERNLAFMREVIQMFHFSKPFFITKGNHDENNNGYEEVSLAEIDFSKETYYKRDFNTFTQVTEDTWDGTDLFRYNPQLITDKEFKNIIQKYLSPSTAVWGDGAYFYYDFADLKIRFVVLNSFPVNEARAVFEGTEWKWFAETALNLSDKDTPTDWTVVTLKHTKADQTRHIAIINAFQNGTSVSGSQGGVTWDIDYGSVNGGGCKYVGNLHGHEHAYNYTNANGYNDIGFPMLNCKPSEWGDATQYGISVVSIDTANNKVYIDKINGESVYYDY